ncbi:cupin domain-containing protein [Nannocystis bainbridge]|uniref:Cupin domain-containing protein n=1 Tax=Nannocystis bainbridge TaxID=2995303 RepID=A0ABT5DSF0_9BACT|nr:cupin domain-containing protein [Nannocystis bainbridge]MDC0715306.1 cupin domain-containing protein [Nannocystis bainbridge]
MPHDPQAWIDALRLVPHPEGGHYRETYRAALGVVRDGQPRTASTAIYYLLRHGERSRLHRIRSDELWHFHAGDGLQVHVFADDGHSVLRLGLDLAAAEAPQQWVAAGAWFGAEVERPGGWALVSCTVAPGFEFADLEFADRAALVRAFPESADIITRLT